MNDSRLNALLVIIVPDIVAIIAAKQHLSQDDAIAKFYSSKIYALLANPKSALWHYSSLLIYELFNEEQKSGNIKFPEEAA
ncbi:MAG: hypothetical protein LBQ47_08035 [Endomicrobium sp.]|jgi:hypothetical protein|nr:hypothetical protein [Endomicrobium sp.]